MADKFPEQGSTPHTENAITRNDDRTIGQDSSNMASYPPDKTPGLPGSHPVNMPMRQASSSSAMSDGEAIPDTDPRDTSGLLAERLQAWKHAVAYLEAYVTATEKLEKAQVKEYEKVLKTISDPLKEGAHFDQSLGGIAGLFENMRANTQGLANSHLETEKNLKGSVLPILERLHKEIKNKSKELASGVSKGAKEVEKARNTTQKHIELLGAQTADFSSRGGRITATEDPYVTQRGVLHRLHKQVIEENNNRQDLISVQNNFAAFEHHVVEVIQQAMASFNQFVGGQAQRDQTMYADILSTAQRIPPDFEWNGFVQRNSHVLIDPNSGPRSVDSIKFANQDHNATQPLIEGTLERKSRSMLSTGYTTGYYVVTPSNYLHGFKDSDNIRKDPVPDISIYLPEAIIGATNGPKFNVKGKDVSPGLSGKLSGNAELAFKAHTAEDAEKWFTVIKSASAHASPESSYPMSPISPASPITPIDKRQNTFPTATGTVPADKRVASGGSIPPQYSSEGQVAQQPQLQTQGIVGGQTVASPVSAAGPSTIPEKM